MDTPNKKGEGAHRRTRRRTRSEEKEKSPPAFPLVACLAGAVTLVSLFLLFSSTAVPVAPLPEVGSAAAGKNDFGIPARLRKRLSTDVAPVGEAAPGRPLPLSPSENPMSLEEIISYLRNWLRDLHQMFVKQKHSSHVDIWKAYAELTERTLYKWDREYLRRMPPRRDDGSIFLSIASYRDENCPNTIKWAFEKSKEPEKLFVGLVQQNCEAQCRTGVLVGGSIEDTDPDPDCHALFCASTAGKKHCDAGRVRVLRINETESLGPYAGRYFASKLWYGEQWYMQIDSHMTFAQDWDATSLEMMNAAPSEKPVLSHYPPPETVNFAKAAEMPAARLCGPVFADSDLEAQIIRLEGLSNYDQHKQKVPKFAPFTAAGYFVAHSEFLKEVPFDPFLPWIFMGEEIIMSARLWTHGYDIFSPTVSVVGHMYVRRHKPKFWETVHRVFAYGIHTPLQLMVLDRVKFLMKYPEAARDMISTKSILAHVEEYAMGDVRTVDQYLEFAGLDMIKKRTYQDSNHWCKTGHVPPGFEQYKDLYTY